MLIDYVITAIAATKVQHPNSLSAFPHLVKTTPIQDIFHISEEAQLKIDQLQQGYQSLQQAVRQSRLTIRDAAQERIRSAKEYLKILIRLSPAGDKAAAHEAARIAREVKSAAHEFKGSIAGEERTNARSEIKAFAEVAEDALKMAQSLIDGYLRKKASEQRNGNDLKGDIRNAFSTLREISGSAGKTEDS